MKKQTKLIIFASVINISPFTYDILIAYTFIAISIG